MLGAIAAGNGLLEAMACLRDTHLVPQALRDARVVLVHVHVSKMVMWPPRCRSIPHIRRSSLTLPLVQEEVVAVMEGVVPPLEQDRCAACATQMHLVPSLPLSAPMISYRYQAQLAM